VVRGFGGIEFAKADEPMLIGRDVDDVLEYERTFPSAREVLTGLSPAQGDELTRQVRDRLVAYASPGGVTMPARPGWSRRRLYDPPVYR
jgi:hypothetical protein